MKLKTRLLLCMLTLFCTMLAAFGSAMPALGFAIDLKAATKAALAQHAQAEQTFLLAAAQAEEAAGAGTRPTAREICAQVETALNAAFPAYAVYSPSYAKLAGRFPAGQAAGRQELLRAASTPGAAGVYTGGEAPYLLCASLLPVLDATYTLVTGYDLSPLYDRRDRQILLFRMLYPFFLAMVTVVCLAFSNAFTRPLRRLNEACSSIAAGAYGERTALPRSDEIGELSRSFDAMAAAVQDKLEMLELSVRQREEFMGALTHELKTPMTAMMGYAALLEQNTLPPPQRAKALRYIHNETRRLEQLSQKLLQLLRIAEEPPALAPLDCTALLEKLRAALPPSWEQDYAFSWPERDVLAALPAVQGDTDLLADLLRNLIENALRASTPGSPVAIFAQPLPGGGLCLGVQDHGCGIPPAALARVTEPFYMVDKSRARAQNGSGLGLALCARIAKAHGGTLMLQSEPGRGTRAVVELPPCPPQQEVPV